MSQLPFVFSDQTDHILNDNDATTWDERIERLGPGFAGYRGERGQEAYNKERLAGVLRHVRVE